MATINSRSMRTNSMNKKKDSWIWKIYSKIFSSNICWRM